MSIRLCTDCLTVYDIVVFHSSVYCIGVRLSCDNKRILFIYLFIFKIKLGWRQQLAAIIIIDNGAFMTFRGHRLKRAYRYFTYALFVFK